MTIDNLSLAEKIGQKFIFGVNKENVDCIIKLIRKCYIGGVILYKKNYRNYQEMLEVVKKIKCANKNNKIPLFVVIDQEGGKVNRLPNEIHNLRNIYDVSKKNKKLIDEYAAIISEILIKTGINMNFAPVLDVYNNSKSKALFKRCFYGDQDEVTECGINYINSSNKRLISVIKHYPGHGATKRDSHFFMPYVYNYQSILNKDIKPFNKLIDNGIDALMVGHLIIRYLTGLLPASISNHFIDNYLRNNYNGLIITDEINMIKRWPLYRFTYLKKALKGHSDILLVKIKDENEGYKILNKYHKLMNLEQLDDSVKRIIKIKEKYKIDDNINYDGINIDMINKLVDKLNNQID